MKKTLEKVTWKTTELNTFNSAIDKFIELEGKKWIVRGQSKVKDRLLPSIDRPPRHKLNRREKIILELESINKFRLIAKKQIPGDENNLDFDINTLMLMQHYGIPTRLLDWSRSAFIAACFAVEGNESDDGELWAFDYDMYLYRGDKQWRKYPELIFRNDGNNAIHKALEIDYQSNWIMMQFNRLKLHRYDIQKGCFTFASQFNTDHAELIAKLLVSQDYFHKYKISRKIKNEIKRYLMEMHGISLDKLYPDIAGAAFLINKTLFPSKLDGSTPKYK